MESNTMFSGFPWNGAQRGIVPTTEIYLKRNYTPYQTLTNLTLTNPNPN